MAIGRANRRDSRNASERWRPSVRIVYGAFRRRLLLVWTGTQPLTVLARPPAFDEEDLRFGNRVDEPPVALAPSRHLPRMQSTMGSTPGASGCSAHSCDANFRRVGREPRFLVAMDTPGQGTMAGLVARAIRGEGGSGSPANAKAGPCCGGCLGGTASVLPNGLPRKRTRERRFRPATISPCQQEDQDVPTVSGLREPDFDPGSFHAA